MNSANTVSSATIGTPHCIRTTTRRSTIEAHCQRVRRKRSRRSVRTKSARGVIFMLSNDVARARKHATAKKPESSNSRSKARVLKNPPEETRRRGRGRHSFWFVAFTQTNSMHPEQSSGRRIDTIWSRWYRPSASDAGWIYDQRCGESRESIVPLQPILWYIGAFSVRTA